MSYAPLLALLLLAQAHEGPAYRVDVEAVRVDVFVSRKGNALFGLTKDDFELFATLFPAGKVQIAAAPWSVDTWCSRRPAR